MRIEGLHVDRPIPSRAHDLSQPFGVVLVGLVELHLQSGLHSPGVQTLDIEASAAQAVNEPGCHRTGLDAHFGVDTSVLRNASRNCSRISGADAAPEPSALLVDNADRGRLLRYVQPNIMRHRNLRWCKPPGDMPGSRYHRLLGFAPRLPEVHIWECRLKRGPVPPILWPTPEFATSPIHPCPRRSKGRSSSHYQPESGECWNKPVSSGISRPGRWRDLKR